MKKRNPQIESFLEVSCLLCEAAKVEIDGQHGGAVHQWVAGNVNYDQDQEFWIVTLLAWELADRKARRLGYSSQAECAAKRAFSKCEIVL